MKNSVPIFIYTVNYVWQVQKGKYLLKHYFNPGINTKKNSQLFFNVTDLSY